MVGEVRPFVPFLERVLLLWELRFSVRPRHRTAILGQPLPRHVSQNLSVLDAPGHTLLSQDYPRTVLYPCARLRELAQDVIVVFNRLLQEALWKPHVIVLSLEVQGMAWGPKPESLESHTTEVQQTVV